MDDVPVGSMSGGPGSLGSVAKLSSFDQVKDLVVSYVLFIFVFIGFVFRRILVVKVIDLFPRADAIADDRIWITQLTEPAIGQSIRWSFYFLSNNCGHGSGSQIQLATPKTVAPRVRRMFSERLNYDVNLDEASVFSTILEFEPGSAF